MSKKKNISYLFGLAFLLLAGCDTDTATVPLPDDGERAVEVRLRASVCTVETTVSRSVNEGNGRMSRLLTLLLLYRSGYLLVQIKMFYTTGIE